MPIIDDNRSRGHSTAPWRLEFAIDVYCPHCSDEHAALAKALEPLAGPRLRITTRNLVRRTLPNGGELARYLLAAAAVDRPTHTALVALLLGTRPNLAWKELRTRVADGLDVERIETAERQHRELLVEMVKDDQRTLRECAITASTPALALVEVATGRTVRRWMGGMKPETLAAEVAERVGR